MDNSTSAADCPVDIPGFIHHGNCHLLCRPAAWTDILIFFLGNYVAHAATVVSTPGQSTLVTVFVIVMALLFPGGGVRTGMTAIRSLAKFASSDLQMAARAGALYAVVRAESFSEGGETLMPKKGASCPPRSR